MEGNFSIVLKSKKEIWTGSWFFLLLSILFWVFLNYRKLFLRYFLQSILSWIRICIAKRSWIRILSPGYRIWLCSDRWWGWGPRRRPASPGCPSGPPPAPHSSPPPGSPSPGWYTRIYIYIQYIICSYVHIVRMKLNNRNF